MTTLEYRNLSREIDTEDSAQIANRVLALLSALTQKLAGDKSIPQSRYLEYSDLLEKARFIIAHNA